MAKAKLGPQELVYPMPAFLVGALNGDCPNFATVAWGGIVCSTPPMVGISLRPSRFTYKCIKEHSTFSVNIPSITQVAETDFCGIISGSKIDKVFACDFHIFYGALKTAPLIEECPMNLECTLSEMTTLGSHVLMIGEIIESYVSEECLTNGRPDVDKIRPLSYSAGRVAEYRALGEILGPAF
ncbi:MAG: flavin reductase family protein [Dehalococcoidia bacterium]|nr:flavin reductase family protein [Dehalococcoidia bacterium]